MLWIKSLCIISDSGEGKGEHFFVPLINQSMYPMGMDLIEVLLKNVVIPPLMS